MSLQTIIDNATFITIKRKRLASQSVSRSGRVLTAEVASAEPYRFVIGMHNGLTYSENRDLVETLDNLDVTEESTIDIGGTNSGLTYITEYKGGMTPTQVGQCAINGTPTGTNIVVSTFGVVGTPANAFKKGDYIQLGSGYRYPYTVTADVAWNASTVTVPIHRPFIPQDSYTASGKPILVGKDIEFNVKMVKKLDYTIVPHDRLSFEGDFEVVEIIRKEDG